MEPTNSEVHLAKHITKEHYDCTCSCKTFCYRVTNKNKHERNNCFWFWFLVVSISYFCNSSRDLTYDEDHHNIVCYILLLCMIGASATKLMNCQFLANKSYKHATVFLAI